MIEKKKEKKKKNTWVHLILPLNIILMPIVILFEENLMTV